MNLKLAYIIVCASMLLSSCVRLPVADYEKQVFATLSQITNYGISVPPDYFKYEKFVKKMFYDNTFMLEYEYNAPKDVHSKYIYLNEAFIFKRSISDISIDDLTQKWLTTNEDFATYGIKLSEKHDVFSWGEKSKLYDIIGVDDQAVGNYFVASYGKMMFTFIAVGFSINQKEVWTQLLKDRLDKVKDFSIGFYSIRTK